MLVTINDLSGAPVIFQAVYNTSLAQTVLDFVAVEAGNLVAPTMDIIVTASGNDILFRSLDKQYNTATVGNFSGGLEGTIPAPAIETYHVLSPVCGCFAAFYRLPETQTVVEFLDLSFGRLNPFSISTGQPGRDPIKRYPHILGPQHG